MDISFISNETQLKVAINETSPLKVFYFQCENTPQCDQMSMVLNDIVKMEKYKEVSFYKIHADKCEDLVEQMKIKSVPTFLFYNDKEIDRLVGADVPVFVKKLESLSSNVPDLEAVKIAEEEDLDLRLKKLINKAPCMLFMKGNPNTPRCGFSKQVIELLNRHKARFETFDILEDLDVREGLKTYSDWPTYPQLYINGELVGGLDILKEMSTSGELDELLPKQTTKEELEKRLQGLINKANVMIFMKGSPKEPRCKFSKALMEMIGATGVNFDTFDILCDNEVREGLKMFSNWPTYPQVYVKGQLIGGIDILKELQAAGELTDALEGKESSAK